MKHYLLFIIAILFIMFSCCKDSSTNPTNNITVVMDTHFDNQGQPSLSGWQDGYPIYGRRKSSYSFSNDIPLNGGIWSLKVFTPDSFESIMRYAVRLPQPTQSKRYRLIFASKSLLNSYCSIQFQAFYGTSEEGAFYGVSSPFWKQDSVYYNSNDKTTDSLVVYINVYSPSNNKIDTTKYVLFNEFKIEEY
ncbi:MAG: hypothetical protein ABSD46_09325 [Bacteroidota bacterium]